MKKIESLKNRLRSSVKLELFLERIIPTSLQPAIAQGWDTKVVVFHVGRSGSTVLGDLMAQNSRVFWADEVYHHLYAWSWEKDEEKCIFDAKKSLISNLFLARLLNSRRKNVYGFEVKPYHLEIANIDLEEYINFIQKTAGVTRFVILKRNNYLRKIISSQIGKMTGKFHRQISQKTERKSSATKIDLNYNVIVRIGQSGRGTPLIEHFHYFERCFERLNALLAQQPTLQLSYEEHIQKDPNIAAKLLSDFIGLEYQPGKIRYQKINPYSIEDMVTNFDELKEYLSGTEYEWMLYQ